jgi:hypothetical protein
MSKNLLLNTLTLGLLQTSLAAMAQRTEGHLLRENEVQKIQKSL